MKIVKSDLENYKKIVALYEKDIDDTDRLNVKIESFISDLGTKFSGVQYKNILDKMTYYKELMNNRIKNCTDIKNKINEIIKILSNYLDEYDYIDTSNLENIRYKRNLCKNSLNDIVNISNSFRFSNLNNNISVLDNEIKQIDRLVILLEELEKADSLLSSTIEFTSFRNMEVE